MNIRPEIRCLVQGIEMKTDFEQRCNDGGCFGMSHGMVDIECIFDDEILIGIMLLELL